MLKKLPIEECFLNQKRQKGFGEFFFYSGFYQNERQMPSIEFEYRKKTGKRQTGNIDNEKAKNKPRKK